MRFWRAPVLHLTVGVTTVRAEARRAGVATWAGESTYDSLADLTEIIARLAAAPAERCRRLMVTLERPPAQTRVLQGLPPLRERDLGQLVANQAGRFFRRNGAPLVTDATWVQDGVGRVTHAAAVEEPLLLAVVAGAAQAGLIVDGIGAAGVSTQLQLLPSAERAVRQRVCRRSLIRLGIAACAVWIVAGALFSVRLLIEERGVTNELAAADAPLAALRDVRREMRTVEAMVVGLANAKRSRGDALAALARVNASLPDSAVVTSYTWRGDGTGVVAGTGQRAADVLAALERRQAVANPRMDGAIVREAFAGREWERFTIVFGAGRSSQ